MSDELLNKIFEKLVSMDKRIDNMESNMATKQDIAAINERLNRIEKAVDYTRVQVVAISESITKS